jgi:hypothetical protein
MTDQDPTIAALLDERARARDPEHRKQIDHELKARGHKADDAKADGDADDAADDAKGDESAADKRAAAGGKATAPESRTTVRGKQTSA